MRIREEDLVRIGEYVRGNLKEWMQQAVPEVVPVAADPVTNTQLLERVVRLDERFVSLDGRVEALAERVGGNENELRTIRQSVEATARAVDAVDGRMGVIEARFGAVDARFDSVDARLTDQRHHFDKRLSLLTWLIGSLIALATGILAVTVL